MATEKRSLELHFAHSKSAHVITRCGRFDLRQPHRIPAFGAREDSDFSPAVDWIWIGRWHDARLKSGGSVMLSVTGNCRQGAEMGASMLSWVSESLVTIAHFSK
jgi:hypothetical protein